MSHLYPHLRIHQIFGANTDVGKTIFTTGLALASAALPLHADTLAVTGDGALDASKGERVHYIKPISTGPLRDSDSQHIARYLPSANAHTLFQFNDPVSPHVAAARFRATASTDSERTLNTSDEAVLSALSAKLSSFVDPDPQGRRSAAYVETAGGVHSPAPSGSSFSALLRPLRLPTILIGDSNLGGISTTKSAYDSLLLAGYDVEALLLFSDANRGWGNADYLRRWGQEIGLPVWALAGPSSGHSWGLPPVRPSASHDADDLQQMRSYYQGFVRGRGQDAAEADESPSGLVPVIEHLRKAHQRRIERLASMAQGTRDHCWWPFTQHMLAKSNADVNVIDSAYGDFFTVLNQAPTETSSSLLKPLLDGSASWWTQCLGHADAGLTRAAARAAGRYGHILFPMCANEPALQLSETLIGKSAKEDATVGTAPGTGWASRVFFSDDGSTGMEVALKMAIASSSSRYAPRSQSDKAKAKVEKGRLAGTQGGRPQREWKVLGLRGSYHGDTIGAMDACESSVYTDRVEWYRGRGTWFEAPTVSVKHGKAFVKLPLHDQDWQSSATTGAQDTFEYERLGDVYNVEQRLGSDELAAVYTKQILSWLDRTTRIEGNQYGALVLEPLVMGAGGMICVDPLFQRCFVDVVRNNPHFFSQSDPPLRRAQHGRSPDADSGEWRGLPVIFDEVFTGLYRLGHATPSDVLGVRPDISVLAKILTGGMVPMSVTLASDSIFATFAKSDQKADALLHGHSYTAHPIGCEVANETLRRIESMREGGEWSEAVQDWSHDQQTLANGTPFCWSFWSREAVEAFSRHERIESAMAMGTVLVVTLRDASGQSGYSSSAAVDLLQHLRTTSQVGSQEGSVAFNIHARPLGNVVYIMCSLNTPVDVRRRTEQALLTALRHV